jgi:soluble lytic murein transglycosylase
VRVCLGRLVGLSLLILPVAAASSASAAPVQGYWLEPQAAQPDEQALRQALSHAGATAPTAQSLLQVSAANPGTVVSGLAQLHAGLLLIEGGRTAEGLAALRHPDVARTALQDYAFRGIAQALEAAGNLGGAGESHLAAAAAAPAGPLACSSLFAGADALGRAGRFDPALQALNKAFANCAGQEPRALLALATLHERRGDLKAAAEAYDRLDSDYPASPEDRDGERRLRLLQSHLPPATPEAQTARTLKKATAIFDAGHVREAIAAFRALRLARPKGLDVDLLHLRLGRALMALERWREARVELTAIPVTSPQIAEAAYALAKIDAHVSSRPDAYEAVATGFAGTQWGEEALFSLANFYQKDARDAEALPYYRRLLDGYPDGRYAERAAWRVAWGDYRAGHYAEAAQVLERAARLRTTTLATPGFLYWAGRAHFEMGEAERARALLEETRQRFKHSYHGLRAQEVLGRLPVAAPAVATAMAFEQPSPPAPDLPGPELARVQQLMLIDRLDEAREELSSIPPTRTAYATIAWIDARRGRLLPARISMKRAYPEWIGEAGDALPDEVWRIMYPMNFASTLVQKSVAEGVDPALVAALICQESTFDPAAHSPAGARGLMQVIPKTGRTLAHELGLRLFKPQSLYDPNVSLSFGIRYLKGMIERFGGHVERALAAYNAGPHRVDAWTAGQPEIGAEEFIESIPFTETRLYVMTILANREQYRRLYSLPAPPPAGMATAASAGGGGR